MPGERCGGEGERRGKNGHAKSDQKTVLFWEVLKGVGVDGAGGNLPLFFVFLCFSSLFFAGISPLSSLFCALS